MDQDFLKTIISVTIYCMKHLAWHRLELLELLKPADRRSQLQLKIKLKDQDTS